MTNPYIKINITKTKIIKLTKFIQIKAKIPKTIK